MGFDLLGASRRPHITKPAAIALGLVFGALFGFISFHLLTQSSILPSWTMTRAVLKQRSEVIEPSVQKSFVENAFRSVDDSYRVIKKSQIVLIPHHLVAAREIASVLVALPQPKRIILLAPDHLGVGKTSMTVGDEAISVFDQIVQSDPYISKDLLSTSSVSKADEKAISQELSMQALYPFIAHAFPKATITPVLIRIGYDTGIREGVAKAIIEMLRKDPNTLLISTVDFSHYQTAFVADFHDILAEDVIQGLADLESDNVELDSAGVLAVTLKVARSLGLGRVTIHAHTNSLRILESKLSQESTSHFIASLSPGPILPQKKTTMLFLGDMMFDREVENRMARSKDDLYPFTSLMGKEGRFFKGQDLIIANLEGPITNTYRVPEKENDFAFDEKVVRLLKRVGITMVSQANNHTLDQGREGAEESRTLLEKGGILWVGDQTRIDPSISMKRITVRGQDIAILAFNTAGAAFDQEKAAEVLSQAATATYRVVYIHWGNEYQAKPSTQQIDLAHWFIDHGVDAVIGTHPHWMQSIEVYKQKIIAYSLGNTVFDQDWSEETRFGLLAGLVLSSSESELHLFPIRVNKSEPILLTAEQRQSRLNVLADISDVSLRDQIKSGVVKGR